MRTFLRDRANQVVLGLFVATFVFTLLVLREVRSETDSSGRFVPGVSLWAAFVLLLACIAAFIYYIDHMAHAIRASTVVTSIWAETSSAIARTLPEGAGSNEDEAGVEQTMPGGHPTVVLTAPKAGVLIAVDVSRILEIASMRGRAVEIVPLTGEFVPRGAPLARLWGDWDAESGDKVRAAIEVGNERSIEMDPAFGFRQLVDVAIRALSPGTNDPTTAVQSLDRIHDLLRQLRHRRFPPVVRTDERGECRVIAPRRSFDDFVHLGLDEIRLAGANQIQVVRRMDAILADLAAAVGNDRQAAIRTVRAQLRDPHEVEAG